MALPGARPLAAVPDPSSGAATVAPALAPDAACCKAARMADGWCDRHEIGFVASIPIRSRLLYETLDAHGHVIDPNALACDVCRQAFRTEGYCERDRIGFVTSLAYFSRLTYELARGEKKLPETIACPVCRRNAQSHGWCEESRVGMIGAVQAKDRDGYEKAAAAVEILIAANEIAARCEECAMAMVTDSLCPRHRIRYRDGQAVSVPARP